MHTRLFALTGFASGIITAGLIDIFGSRGSSAPFLATFFTIGVVGGIGGLLRVKLEWPLKRILMFVAANLVGLLAVFFIFAWIFVTGMNAFDDPSASSFANLVFSLTFIVGPFLPGLVYSGAMCLFLHRYFQRRKMFFFCAATSVLGVCAAVAFIPIVGPHLALGAWYAGFATVLSRVVVPNSRAATVTA